MRSGNRDSLGIIFITIPLKQIVTPHEGVIMYVFVEKYRKFSLNYPCYPILSGALDPVEVSILQTGCILDMNVSLQQLSWRILFRKYEN